MQYKQVATIHGGQDGAIFNNILFRFDAGGRAWAFSLEDVTKNVPAPVLLSPIAEFRLDALDRIVPHCNAVTFGGEYWEEGDDFPLLYANLYNNYANSTDRQEGTVCVYRLQRSGTGFITTLVQVIRVGFIGDRSLWMSMDGSGDVRPYGNFVVDASGNKLYAFVMRDAEHITRFFTFDLPGARDGEFEEKTGVNCVTLTTDDIRARFDGPYMRYMQGACCHEGRIWSVEGFSGGSENPPALRVIDMQTSREILYDCMPEHGLDLEAEFIDFRGSDCLYSDCKGNVYLVQ